MQYMTTAAKGAVVRECWSTISIRQLKVLCLYGKGARISHGASQRSHIVLYHAVVFELVVCTNCRLEKKRIRRTAVSSQIIRSLSPR